MVIAKELMNKPITISKNSNISQVITKMIDINKSRLVVMDESKSVGIVTEKDIGFFLFSSKSNQSLDRIPLVTIMKGLVFTENTTPVMACAKKMVEKNISSLAVGDEKIVEGIFTKSDLTKFYSTNCAKQFKVEEYMTNHYFTVHDVASLSRVMAKMMEHKISRILTKDQNNNPNGMISFRDFFRVSLELGVEEVGDFSLSDNIRRGFLTSGGFGEVTIAREIMTRGIYSIKKTDDLANACKEMINHNVNGLGVLDEKGQISGVISKTDVMRALASFA